jgi:hypothetical protein
MKHYRTDWEEQRKALGYNKNCKCYYRIFLNGVVVKGVNPKCRAHDTLWQKFKTYLKPKAESDQRNQS